QSSTGFGAIFLVGDDLYWYNINFDYMNHFNFIDKSFETVELPENFGSSVTFNSPFVVKGQAYLIANDDLWSFDNDSKTWTSQENGIQEGAAFPDDVFVIDETVYMIDNGNLSVLK